MPIYALGPFHLDTKDDLLLRGAEPTALGRRAIALLRVLVERPGAVVSKAGLIEAAWRGRAVEESDLTVPAHNWFTEGFDTPDLKAAKALLDALR